MTDKKTQKRIQEELDKELRKSGINPDTIGEYGDVDFEDYVDESTYIPRPQDSWGEYGDDDY